MNKLLEVCQVLTRFHNYSQDHGVVDVMPFAVEIDKIYNPKSVSETSQEELEPLPGVPRYTSVVVG